MSFGGFFGKSVPQSPVQVAVEQVVDTVVDEVLKTDNVTDVVVNYTATANVDPETVGAMTPEGTEAVVQASLLTATVEDLLADPLKYMTSDILWYFALICASFFLSFGLGYGMVEGLRRTYRTYNKIQTLALIPLLSPVLVFITLNALSMVGVVDLVIADSFTFGLLLGTVYTLSLKPSGKFTHKLIVNQLTAPSVEVWLDASNVKIGDVRQVIASEGLKIAPASRVCIESGKGRVLEDMSIDFNTIKQRECTDFFGFTVCSCYVTVREADQVPQSEVTAEGTELKKKKSNFMSLLNTKGEAKFGVELSIIAKVPTARNTAAPFYISGVDMFAAAAPTQATRTMRFVKWDAAADRGDKAEPGDEWDSTNLASPRQRGPPPSAVASNSGTPLNGPGSGEGASGNNIDLRASGQPIRHGDEIVLECEGKYMSVARGWWLKWGSTIPRRSGAFTVEIIEKAPQNVFTNHIKDFGRDIGDTLKETFERMDVLKVGDQLKSQSAAHGTVSTATVSAGRVDPSVGKIGDHIRTGDAFRLRSVKFPDYELGITNVKIRDEYTYLGLRKIGDTASAGSDNWCQEVWFYVKLNSMATELFKLPK